MAMSKAATVAEYLAELPADRRKEIAAARALVRKHMPKGYKEAMGYGMITWTIRTLYLHEYLQRAAALLRGARGPEELRIRLRWRRAHQGTVNRPSFTQTWPFTETVRSVKKFQRT